MTEKEILEKAKIIDVAGMAVNERLYASGLIDKFDKAKKSNKYLAKLILEALRVDKSSINKILDSNRHRHYLNLIIITSL